MACLDQLGKVPEKQRQQQDLDVGAVDIGVRQNANLAVAQAAQIGGISRTVRIDTDGHRNVVNLVVGKEPVTLHLPRIEDLATQRQNRLALLVAPHLGTAAGGVALDQKNLVVRQIAAFAISQFSGQNRHSRTLALLDLLPGFLAHLCRLDHQLSQFLAVLHVLVQPQFQTRTNKARHQAHGVA